MGGGGGEGLDEDGLWACRGGIAAVETAFPPDPERLLKKLPSCTSRGEQILLSTGGMEQP